MTEELGGLITVDSVEGRYTKFVVTLPILQPPGRAKNTKDDETGRSVKSSRKSSLMVSGNQTEYDEEDLEVEVAIYNRENAEEYLNTERRLLT